MALYPNPMPTPGLDPQPQPFQGGGLSAFLQSMFPSTPMPGMPLALPQPSMPQPMATPVPGGPQPAGGMGAIMQAMNPLPQALASAPRPDPLAEAGPAGLAARSGELAQLASQLSPRDNWTPPRPPAPAGPIMRDPSKTPSTSEEPIDPASRPARPWNQGFSSSMG